MPGWTEGSMSRPRSRVAARPSSVRQRAGFGPSRPTCIALKASCQDRLNMSRNLIGRHCCGFCAQRLRLLCVAR